MESKDMVLYERLMPKIEEAFSDKKNIDFLIKGIKAYADKHSNILLTVDLSQRLIFADSDKKLVFNAVGISEDEVKKTINDCTSIAANWKKATNTFYMISMLIMTYFYKKPDKESQSYGDAVAVYLGYLLYTTSHKMAFPHLPNQAVVEYTLANLSNRYLIIQLGSIQACIEYTITEAIHGRYNSEIRRGSDSDYAIIISSLSTRMSSFIKNIADEVYVNIRNGNYLNHEEDSEDEEDYHPGDNKSYKIDRIVQVTVSSIMTKGFDQKSCIQRSVSINPGVSFNKLDAMLRVIVEEDAGKIEDMVSSILTLFMYKGSNTIDDVGTMKFVSEALQIYKSNAQDGVTYHVKDILGKWIDLASEKYGRNYISRGKTSLDNYKRAIYSCFVFKIFECAK